MCQLRDLSYRCTSAKCYDERVAHDFCRADFCMEASIKSERIYEGQTYHNITYATYQFRPVRLFRFTPIAIQAIKSSAFYTPAETGLCGVRLSRSAIYYLCGEILGTNAVITSCNYVKRTETLNLAERSFFISGYKKANCLPSDHSLPGQPYSPVTSAWSTSQPLSPAHSGSNGSHPGKQPVSHPSKPSHKPSSHHSSHKPSPFPVNLPVIHTLPTLATLAPASIHGMVTLPSLAPVQHKPSPVPTVPFAKPTKNSTKPSKTRKPTKPPAIPIPPGAPEGTVDMLGPPGPPGSPANGDYFCLLIPINALSLNRFLKYLNGRQGSAIDSTGQYVLYCPNQFFCIPQTTLLEALHNISVLELKSMSSGVDYKTSAELERMYSTNQEFKALIPKPLLPMCKDFNQTTFVLPPWLIPNLSVLQPPTHLATAAIPCSDTDVQLDCELSARVVLPDGTVITAAPLQEPVAPTTITTPDGSTISVPNGQSSVVTAPDGTEAILRPDGSSRVVLPDKTLVAITADKNVILNMSDSTHVLFNQNGMTVTLPDHTVVVTSEYGMVCTTPDGKNTLIPVDSNGAEVHTETGSEIIVTEGLNAEIKASSGTQVLITPTDTTIGGKDGVSANIMPDGTVTVTAPGGLALVFSVDAYVNVTTADGTVASIGQDDSLYVINEMEIIVVFPNANSMVVTKDEIISLESDGTVTVTDALGSNQVLALDDNAIPCEDVTCFATQ